jgi:hypothetical protein
VGSGQWAVRMELSSQTLLLPPADACPLAACYRFPETRATCLASHPPPRLSSAGPTGQDTQLLYSTPSGYLLPSTRRYTAST